MIDILNIVGSAMQSLGLVYEFMLYTGEKVPTYFVGECEEIPTESEDGHIESNFILNGFTTESWAELLKAKEKIEAYFGRCEGKKVMADDGSVVTIFYEKSLPIQTGSGDFKRLEIHLKVEEWKVKL